MKCTKVNNPCKICFQHVNKKNGLQCQGACQKWAHYKCLNYTPGKIQDIKGGYIKVTCPCPDCSTSEAKETLVDPPYTCTNTQCPASKLPVCTFVECPSKENTIPTYPSPPFEYSPAQQLRAVSPSNLKKCPIKLTTSSPKLKTKCQQSSKNSPNSSKVNSLSKCSGSLIYLKPKKHSISCSPYCPTQQTSKSTNKKMCSPKQSKSCSNLSNSSFLCKEQFENLRAISSDSQVPKICMDHKMLYKALENVCNTVGQLSNQLKELMCKMNETIVK